MFILICRTKTDGRTKEGTNEQIVSQIISLRNTLCYASVLVSEEKKLEDAALTASTRLKEALQKEIHEKKEVEKTLTVLQVSQKCFLFLKVENIPA